MKVKAGAKKDGTLTALEFIATATGGAYPAGGTSILDWLVRELYLCPHVRCETTDIFINAGPARPFRAPGHPQCCSVHPSDVAPALVALVAAVQIRGPLGARTVPVAELHVPPGNDPLRETYLEPGEVVTAIQIPAPPRGLRSSYRKVRARQAWDFVVAGLALALAVDQDGVQDARVVLSGAAPVPWRSREAEEALNGRRLTVEVAVQAAEAAMAKAEALEHNAYKIPMFEGLIQEELRKHVS